MTHKAVSTAADSRHPAPLARVLAITFLGSVSSGTFWAGLFFVTARDYGFSQGRNLVLAALMGGIYALAARSAGRLSRAVASRAMLSVALATWLVAALLPVLIPGVASLWAAALLGSAASAVTFPIVESYLVIGRHGDDMRSALGKFNLTWTPATAVPLLILPLLARAGQFSLFGLSAIMSACALLAARELPARSDAHEPARALAAIGPEYPWLLRSASRLLPLSYVISSTLAPVLPYRLAAVGVGAPASAVAAAWMAARFGTLFIMWRSRAWHGRWAALGSGGAALVAGLALALLAGKPGTLIVGLLLFGVGMGLIYYSTIYYSMAIGHASVEAGGNFEALIGLGYCAGPLLGIVGQAVAGPSRSLQATVALLWLATALTVPGALRPYFEARRRR